MPNTALSYDGNDRVVIPDTPLLSFGNGVADKPFHIEAIINLAAIPSDIIIKHGQGAQKEWYLSIDNLGQLHFTIYDHLLGEHAGVAGYCFGAFTTDLTPYLGQWMLIGAGYDGGGNDIGIDLYLNGVSVKNYSETVGVYEAMAPKGSPIYIGYGYAWSPMRGIIDEVRISDKKRTLAEESAIWNGGNIKHLPLDNNTIALWRADEGQGVTLLDESPNNLDGSIGGATWVEGYPFSVEPVERGLPGWVIPAGIGGAIALASIIAVAKRRR